MLEHTRLRHCGISNNYKYTHLEILQQSFEDYALLIPMKQNTLSSYCANEKFAQLGTDLALYLIRMGCCISWVIAQTVRSWQLYYM